MSSKISINYLIIMYNFQIETSFVSLNLLAGNPGSVPASTIYFILFTWASPYGTHMEPGCTAHMGPIWVSIWNPYRLLAGCHTRGATEQSPWDLVRIELVNPGSPDRQVSALGYVTDCATWS